MTYAAEQRAVMLLSGAIDVLAEDACEALSTQKTCKLALLDLPQDVKRIAGLVAGK